MKGENAKVKIKMQYKTPQQIMKRTIKVNRCDFYPPYNKHKNWFTSVTISGTVLDPCLALVLIENIC